MARTKQSAYGRRLSKQQQWRHNPSSSNTFEVGYIDPGSYCDEVKLYVETYFRYQAMYFLFNLIMYQT